MKKYKHIILTRFNYPDDYVHIENRMDLFNKYTLPSVKAQTNMDFEWVFFSDKELDIDFKNKRFVTLASYREYKEELKNDFDYIIETRLDNDDVIGPDLIKQIHEKVDNMTYEGPKVIEFGGYRYDARNNAFYVDILYNNKFSSPFISFIYDINTEHYVFDFVHGQMCREFDTVFISPAHWVQIIHNTNKLMNKDSESVIASRGQLCEPPVWWNHEAN